MRRLKMRHVRSRVGRHDDGEMGKEGKMPAYLVLANWTEQGIEDLKESPDRLVAARNAIEAAGGRLTAFYMTMGEYDLAAIIEAPDDATVARMLLGIARRGSIRTKTLRAFEEDEFRSIIDTLP